MEIELFSKEFPHSDFRQALILMIEKLVYLCLLYLAGLNWDACSG